ncbi:uncharacterized protein LOC114074737 [Solanum pennellii]|uniref:Uncharacterized protein LOC114074737 n=1 Tax=Solanum pennellii TaxID=28526 RepID=A0ABM1UYF7_SOLPN|nr:uncharacterized protein LOC114074737 [Solanum pennellii]
MLATTYSRQKSYADNRKRPLEFDVADQVYLKISPLKGVMRFGTKEKLSPRYVGRYEVLQRAGKVAYEFSSLEKLASVHPIFHVSMLKNCLGDPTSILLIECLGVDEDFSYEEIAIDILDRQVKPLRIKEVATVKVLRRNHPVEGATW